MEEASKAILQILLDNFTDHNRSADDLAREYEGVNLVALKQTVCDEILASPVDFDLALKDLEDSELVDTGPIAVSREPGLLSMLSKREFAYLTEKGYKAARKAASAAPRIGKRRGRQFRQ